MGHSQFSDLLFQIKLDAVEISETVFFVAIVAFATLHGIKFLFGIGRKRND